MACVRYAEVVCSCDNSTLSAVYCCVRVLVSESICLLSAVVWSVSVLFCLTSVWLRVSIVPRFALSCSPELMAGALEDCLPLSDKPVIAFVDVKGYELTIINRWGQEIWTTNDPDMAWKGLVDGSYVPQGMYAYYCAFQNGAGRKYEERGTVTFLWGQE